MIYHSNHSDNYSWYLILRGKKNKKEGCPVAALVFVLEAQNAPTFTTKKTDFCACYDENLLTRDMEGLYDLLC